METMNPAQTITFVSGIIMCVIGVATFVAALLTKARKEGQLEYKVDAALKGIDEIKATLSNTHMWQEDIALKVQSHEEKITTLFNDYRELSDHIARLERRGD